MIPGRDSLLQILPLVRWRQGRFAPWLPPPWISRKTFVSCSASASFSSSVLNGLWCGYLSWLRPIRLRPSTLSSWSPAARFPFCTEEMPLEALEGGANLNSRLCLAEFVAPYSPFQLVLPWQSIWCKSPDCLDQPPVSKPEQIFEQYGLRKRHKCCKWVCSQSKYLFMLRG